MRQFCLGCQQPMVRYVPEKGLLPSLFVCPRCGLVAIPNSQTGQIDLHRLVTLPTEIKQLTQA